MNTYRNTCYRVWALLACLTLGLFGCSPSVAETQSGPTQNITQAYQTVNARLTEAAVLTPSLTPQPTATEAAQLSPTAVVVSTPAATQTLANLAPSPGSCDLAAPGSPIDVTIPDDTKLQPGQTFTKVWRLQNSGTCSWNSGYTIGLFSGEAMTLVTTVVLPQDVPPGQSVDISMDLVAPQAPATYQGNWKLKNPQGNWFGIGPNGGSPFWVRIIVEPLPTATATPATPAVTMTVTPTPAVRANGSVTLQPPQKFDLDQVNLPGNEDLSYEINAGGQHLLIPQGIAVMAAVGSSQPGHAACQTANLSAQPMIVESLPIQTYLCYRTSLGLPGWARIAQFNSSTGALVLDYLTWAQP